MDNTCPELPRSPAMPPWLDGLCANWLEWDEGTKHCRDLELEELCACLDADWSIDCGEFSGQHRQWDDVMSRCSDRIAYTS